MPLEVKTTLDIVSEDGESRLAPWMPRHIRHAPPLDHPKYAQLAASVYDSDHPDLVGVFCYRVGPVDGPVRIWLVSFAIEYRHGVSFLDADWLTATRVRDLPLARWEAAARAHLPLNREARELAERNEDALDRVERLHPGLRESTRPVDVRKFNSLVHLAGVAQQYEAEVRQGAPDPAAVIARDREAKPATVRSWLHRARQAGLLAVSSQQARKMINDMPGERMPVVEEERSEEE